MKEKLIEMLNMQNQLNIDTCGPKWAKGICEKTGKNIDWQHAVFVECAEALNWAGYKWWKKQDIDIEELFIEFVDIWHFLLSQYMHLSYTEKYGANVDNVARLLQHTIEEYDFDDLNDIELKDKIIMIYEHLVFSSDYYLAGSVLLKAIEDINKTFDDLYDIYILKNYLNKFRQENGYKDGTYVKVWKHPDFDFKEEDNTILMHLYHKYNDPVEAIRMFANQYAYENEVIISFKWSRGDI